MNDRGLQMKIKELEQELSDLKTIQGGLKNIKCYTYRFTSSGYEFGAMIEVSYEDGDEPVITRAFMQPLPLALKLSGNKQRFWLTRNYGDEIIFVSTRRILSVRDIS